MDGILTDKGIEAWLGGSKRLVKEWDRAYIDTVQSAKVIMFAAASEGKAITNCGVLVAALTAERSDTSLKSEGKFQHENFIATHLGLTVERTTLLTNLVAADVVPLPADWRELEARAWFSLYFKSGNEPHDEGQLTDFPEGPRGFGGQWAMTTTANTETAVAALLTNGINGAGPGLLRSPHRCTVDTRPRLEIEFLHGAVALTVDTGIIARIYGFEG